MATRVWVESVVPAAKKDTLPTNGMGAPLASSPSFRYSAITSYWGPVMFLGPWPGDGAAAGDGRPPPPTPQAARAIDIIATAASRGAADRPRWAVRVVSASWIMTLRTRVDIIGSLAPLGTAT
ncbi:hypothetical protein LBMAG44_10170 [Gemmatimonadota bacterium]|nr:hypothetical protein LBMAG44_10170 [Gemmatimonadota bacterium]